MRALRVRLRPRRPRHRADGDAGMTLVEVLVAMTVFSVLMAVVMTAVVSMTRSAVASQNTADTAAGIRKAFTAMDKQVRYADAINTPGAVGTTSYVEFRVPAALTGDAVLAGGTSLSEKAVTCHQWRYSPTTGVLAERTWVEGQAPPASWSALATSLTGTDQPFALRQPGLSSTFQSLDLTLVASRPAGGVPAALATTFVARNSTRAAPAEPVCGGSANRS